MLTTRLLDTLEQKKLQKMMFFKHVFPSLLFGKQNRRKRTKSFDKGQQNILAIFWALST